MSDVPQQPVKQDSSVQMIAESDLASRCRAFAEPLIGTEQLDTGESVLAHCDAMRMVIATLDGSETLQAAPYLIYACPYLNRPKETLQKAFGLEMATLAVETDQLLKVQRQARDRLQGEGDHLESVRKMLLAFSRDLRVVLLRLSSRLQTLRYFAMVKRQAPIALAQEALYVFAPLANRLGLGQMKWELEDLAFRFLEPQVYKEIALLLDEKREIREQSVAALIAQITSDLKQLGVTAQVQGRAKHIYSIVKKMRGKKLAFHQVMDVRALRILVPTVNDCYSVLGWIQTHFEPIPGEFDDYIAKPKANGYQSVHCVVLEPAAATYDSATARQPIEVQIRTHDMHTHAEHGVAAHWAYKEAGVKGYAGVSASGIYDQKIAVLRQLLAWEREMAHAHQSDDDSDLIKLSSLQTDLLADRIYVLTPDATIIELPQGATAVDFAYAVHTTLGHRCRGAHVDGVLVPLNTPMQNGQTVAITAAKDGGPSRDWLNPDLRFLASHRAKSKVRAWFNAEQTQQTIAKGRDLVERLLQRESKTAIKLDALASQLRFANADALFEAVGKDEQSLRAIELLLRPSAATEAEPNWLGIKKPSKWAAKGASIGSQVLVEGVGDVLTQLAKCCKPVPPDDIEGFVTRGKGIVVHRTDCPNLSTLRRTQEDRLIQVQWVQAADRGGATGAAFAVDVLVQALDRQGLLRDISDVFAKEKINVIGVNTVSGKAGQTQADVAWMSFTIEVKQAHQLIDVLHKIESVQGVQQAKRR